MIGPQQEQRSSPSPPLANQPSSPSQTIVPARYLAVPNPDSQTRFPSPSRPNAVQESELESDSISIGLPRRSVSQTRNTTTATTPTTSNISLRSLFQPVELHNRLYMSVYSASSVDTEHSEYSNPPARQYRVPRFEKMSRKISRVEKDQYILALQTHQINTLVELRRIEKAFAVLGTSDVSEPMTAAWSYYVDSHGLLTELRALTKNYPFSSYCLDEAKSRVYSDPASNRSWNFCWLVLSKIQADQLIPYYAGYQASQPSMWGGHKPSPEQIDQLTNAFVAEWNSALSQMLRHWEQPPTR